MLPHTCGARIAAGVSARRVFLRRPPPERDIRILGRDQSPAEVPQREPVAGRLRGRAPAQHLVEVPVQPFVAVEKAEDVTASTEEDRLRRPRETHAFATLPSGGKDHRLFERSERDRDLQHDTALIELAARREVGLRAIAKRLDHHVVVASRKPAERAPSLGVRQAGELAANPHEPESLRRPGCQLAPALPGCGSGRTLRSWLGLGRMWSRTAVPSGRFRICTRSHSWWASQSPRGSERVVDGR